MCSDTKTVLTYILMLLHELGDHFTSLSGNPDVHQFRRVQTEKFLNPACSVKLIICTTAFCIGVDMPDIRRIIHWGLPPTMEEYVQESERAGHDGKDSVAILYDGKGEKYSIWTYKNYISSYQMSKKFEIFKAIMNIKSKLLVVNIVIYVNKLVYMYML